MRAIFDIEEVTDDEGVVMYTARLASDFDAEGIPDPSGPVGYGETAWEALSALIDEVEHVDPALVLYAGEESLD